MYARSNLTLKIARHRLVSVPSSESIALAEQVNVAPITTVPVAEGDIETLYTFGA